MTAMATLTEGVVRRGEATLIDGVSLEISAGVMTALVGPNGSGKTTALRALAGVLPLTSGEALLGENPVGTLSPDARARRLAYLPQERPVAWPIRAKDAVALGRFAYGARPQRLSAADAAAVEGALAAVGLDAKGNRPLSTLSGGEKARAHVARALASEASALALDEPTAALDPAHGLSVMRALRARADLGVGVLLATHDLGLAAQFCERVVVLRSGRVLGEGPTLQTLTPDLLRAAYGVSAQLFRGDAGCALLVMPSAPSG